MLIDVHSHYLPKELARALERRVEPPRIWSTGGGTFIEYGEGSMTQLNPVLIEPELILARMDEARIDHSVLSVTIPGVDWFDPDDGEQLADAANCETASIVARYPDRFSGLATVPMQAPERAAAVLERAAGMGLKGVMIYSNVAGARLDDPACRVFFDAAARLDVPVVLHPTYPLCAPAVMGGALMEMAGFVFDTTTAALRLVFDGLYERHPELKFVIPHTGGFIPYFSGRIDFIASAREGGSGVLSVAPSQHLKKFFVDTVCGSPHAVRYCCDFFGVDRVMHGTDHPYWPMQLGPMALDGAGLSTRDRAKVEHENAARLFGIQVPARKTAD